MISFCQFGAGRIGAIHAANVAAHPEARLNTIVDTDRAAAQRLAERYGAVLCDQAEALADPAIDAVLIASSTDTHADLIEAAARAGKAIFCEKPLDLDRRRAAACAAVAVQCGVPLMVAFNRRFDPNFARLEREIRAGRIGRPESLSTHRWRNMDSNHRSRRERDGRGGRILATAAGARRAVLGTSPPSVGREQLPKLPPRPCDPQCGHRRRLSRN